MERAKRKQAIVEGDEIGRRKVVKDEDAVRSAKCAKVEGNKASEPPIGVGRNPGGEAEEALCGDELKKVARLRELLGNNAKSLSTEDVDDVIRHLKVEEIVGLALKRGQETGSGGDKAGGGGGEEEEEEEEEEYQSVQVIRIFRRMLHHSGMVKEAEFGLLYEALNESDIAAAVSIRLSSYNSDCREDGSLIKLEDEYRDMIPNLCRVLHHRLFAHIFFEKTGLHLFDESTTGEEIGSNSEEAYDVSNKKAEEADEECNPVLKKAALECDICLGKGKHTGSTGGLCSFEVFVPKGATVGPDYCVVCRDCGLLNERPVDDCFICGSEGGEAVPKNLGDEDPF